MGFILMYDITNEESFGAVQDWWVTLGSVVLMLICFRQFLPVNVISHAISSCCVVLWWTADQHIKKASCLLVTVMKSVDVLHTWYFPCSVPFTKQICRPQKFTIPISTVMAHFSVIFHSIVIWCSYSMCIFVRLATQVWKLVKVAALI